MNVGNYSQMWRDFKPDPIELQIKEIEAEIAIVGNLMRKKVETNQIHPQVAAARMHRLRSVLWTLEQQRKHSTSTTTGATTT